MPWPLFRCSLVVVLAGLLTVAEERKPVQLPPPDTSGGKPLMQALSERRTTRSFRADPLSPQVLSNLLWAAFGINRPESKLRTAPSAWNQQEIDLYVFTAAGVYHYLPATHSLEPVAAGDWRSLTGTDAFVSEAPVSLLYVADFARTPKTAEADRRYYAAADAGFIGQNVYLFSASAGLGTVLADGVDKTATANKLGLRPEQYIIFSQAVGYPK